MKNALVRSERKGESKCGVLIVEAKTCILKELSRLNSMAAEIAKRKLNICENADLKIIK